MTDGELWQTATGVTDSTVVQARDIGSIHLETKPPVPYELFRPPDAPLDDPQRLRNQPSLLLDARRGVIPFFGRTAELSGLGQWLATPARHAAQLVYGTGGQGKTRLAAHFLRECAHRGWTVRYARPALPPGAEDVNISESVDQLIVAVDYADRWPVENLLALITRLVQVEARTVRILLLSRTVRWFQQVRGELAELDVTADQTLLRPLAIDAEGRTTIFENARDAFASHPAYLLPHPDRVRTPETLSESGFETVLSIHSAALVAVDAYSRGRTAPTDQHELSAYLLDREYMNWSRLYRSGRAGNEFRTPPTVMAKLAFVAALVGATQHATATEILARLRLSEDPEPALTDYRLCYPPQDAALVLEPLYPDRIAEDFLALLLPGHDVAAYEADPWTVTALGTLLDPSADMLPAYLPRAITFLAASAERWPHVGVKHLFPLLINAASLLIGAGSAAMTAVASLPGAETNVLTAVEPLLPSGAHRRLAIGAAAVVDRLSRERLAQTTDPARRAQLWSIIGYRLMHAAELTESLTATTESVALMRPLYEAHPQQYADALSLALHNVALIQQRLGRPQDALSAIDESIAIRTHIEPATTDTALNLARSTNVQGKVLADLGKRKDALRSATTAVELLTSDLAGTSQRQRDFLASALLSLAARQSAVGQSTEAEASATAAATLYDSITKPSDVAGPDLANALSVDALHRSGQGHHDDAVARAKHAVDLHRDGADIDPRERADLAAALVNLGKVTTMAGDFAIARQATAEAADLYQSLANENPAIHTKELIFALSNLAMLEFILGDGEAAERRYDRILDMLRPLAVAEPEVYAEDLVCVLNGVAETKLALHQPKPAVAAMQEAIDLLDGLRAANPDLHRPMLALTLTNLGAVLIKTGKRRAAPVTLNKAVHHYQILARRDPAAFRGQLATALLNLALSQAELGKSAALESSSEGLRIREERIAAKQDTTEGLAFATLTYAKVRYLLRQDIDAGLAAADRSRDLYTGLAATQANAFDDDLSEALLTRQRLQRLKSRQ